ncbi:LacI family DNA-binding transcriptional regulator [Tsukamurella soli]|uniref:LacI family DNA-binding transcriptional regulator n=1 Tax=Tsukamurella soli TaxID=644556 RepID=A0ABP8JMB1_9ACTN
MVTKRPTIYDVARHAGVSKSLVSLVLQGSPRVGEDSLRAVQAAIAELGYRPSRAAASLAAQRTRVVGVVIDDYTNLWFVDLVRGLHAELGPRGYRLSVVDVATAAQAEDPVEGLLATRVDGIVVGMEPPPGLVGQRLPPIVVAGTRETTGGTVGEVDTAVNDDAAGAALVVEHLAALGHRFVGHVASGGGAGRAREDGFTAAARAAGIRMVATEWRGPATDGAGYDGARRLLAAHPEVTAVFAANDLMAVGVLGAARDLGRDVPGTLSVVGYDDTSLAAARYVDLTTVDDRSFDVGGEAGRLLAARMAGGGGAPERRVLAPSLVVRGTTGPPRSVRSRLGN